MQKAPGKGLPAWIDRLSAAQYNTFEVCTRSHDAPGPYSYPLLRAVRTSVAEGSSPRPPQYAYQPLLGMPHAAARTAYRGAPQACAYLICTFYVGASLGVPKLLFAKLASLFLALRVAYAVAYFLDIDLLRTQLWLNATYACCLIAFAGLFPESILPMLGEVVKVKVR